MLSHQFRQDITPATRDDEEVDSFGDMLGSQPVPSSPPAATTQVAAALFDLVKGARSFHLWGLLGWQDIRRRYRRSMIGPFWLTISMGILVAALSILYGALLKVEIEAYAPFLALGFINWTLISGFINGGCTAFTDAGSIIKQADLPLSVHVYRVVWRDLIIFFHNAAIFVVVAAVFSIRPGWVGLLALPGLALLCLNGVWMGLLFGLVSARFRDIPPVMDSIVRIFFFVTPIIWMPELLPDRTVLLDFNPFYHYVELVRAPLLGQAPQLASWLAVLGMTLGGWLAALIMFRNYRRRVAYWV